MSSLRLLCGIFFIYLLACTSTPPVSQYAKATFSSKMRLVDLENDQSFMFNLEIFTQKPSLLRMEITTPVGFHIASVTLQDSHFTLIVPSKKIYRQGTSHPQVLEEVLPLFIDPIWIIPILFEEPLENWDCDITDNEVLKACRVDAFTVVWTKRRGYQKTLTISSQQFETTIYIKDFKPYIPADPQLFSLPEISWNE